MTTRRLPPKPSLTNLKKQAKGLLKSLEARDSEAVDRVHAYFDDLRGVGLQDVQLVLAREYGFSSWDRLKERTRVTERLMVGGLPKMERVIIDFACMSYSPEDHQDRYIKAGNRLEVYPEIREASIYSAAVCGDSTRVANFLDEDGSLLDQKGGPRNWEPLLYAAYARIPDTTTFPVAKLLIERGANPNAFYMWGGQYRFTALTGAFGEGEQGPIHQPAHPDCEAFARLLLDAGANPNDSQALYNRMFTEGSRCLKLLLEYGLNRDHQCNWLMDDGSPVTQTVFEYQLVWAVRKGHTERVKLLIEHGADVAESHEEKTLYEWATLQGHNDIAEMLAEHGAEPIALQDMDAFATACTRGDAAESQRLLAQDPTLNERTQDAYPSLLHDAVSNGRTEAVKLMLHLGFSVNRLARFSPLHVAADEGNLDLMKLLIDHGADTTLREPHFNSSPLGHAVHANRLEAVEFLKRHKLDIIDAAEFVPDHVEAMLDANPSLLDITFAEITRDDGKPEEIDWMTPMAVAINSRHYKLVEMLLKRGANRFVKTSDGKTLEAWARSREEGPDKVAQLFDAMS